MIGLSFSATTRLLAYSSYSTSSGAIEVMFPAPSTTPTPLVAAGFRSARPASRRTVSAETPGFIQTCAEKPLSSSWS